MKTLIFTLIFTFQAVAMPTTPTPPAEITDPEITRQLVATAVDIRNEDVISSVPDLRSCQEAFQQQSLPQNTANTTANNTALATLDNCIKTEFGKKSPQQVAALSDKLNLVTHKLIPSKTVQNVTTYMTEKLYESLTGVNLKEQDVARRLQAMKFNNKKQIDHKDFYDLYKNQIAKNALYEVSRFCLEDFRRDPELRPGPSVSENTFVDHWGDLSDFANGQDPTTTFQVSDTGSPKFEQPASGNASNAAGSYRNIVRNIFSTAQQDQIPDEKKLSNFFFFCGKMINRLCSEFEKKCTNGTNCTGTPAATTPNPQAPAQPTNITFSGGQKACLAKTRLTAFKNAMKASDDIVQGLTDNAGADIFLRLDGDAIVKRYERGVGSEKSLNELTNNASADFFKGTQTDSTREAEECATDPSSCDQFVVVNESETRIEQNTQLIFIAKREAELARVRDLVRQQGQRLDEFLEKNYPDLKDKANDPNLVALISQKWDARRVAMVKEIQDKIGARQVTEDEEKITGTKDTVAQNNAKASLSEKTRLAQVVFFNNIISSSLKLRDASGTELGRNIQAFNNELDSAETEAAGEFTNIRGALSTNTNGGSGGGGTNGNESVTNIDFLDEFIGIPASQNGSRRSTAGGRAN